ncbi:protein GRAVITROPIC IN THE LIGHT 1-like [Bidens hawaiensis]|uniref:protein GRAVITROPIC IN THE LIGHT 1-like n=1 Tax=Bidens hawaiensis TaxID=980011 RepID=UPI00404AB166
MDSARNSSNKNRLARTFAKVMHIRAATGIDKFQRSKTREKVKHDTKIDETHQRVFCNDEDEKLKNRAVMDAFIAKLFATISSVKATYAELQYFQIPYDADGVQSADQTIVSELKTLSELKQSFLKKHLDDINISPETTQRSAEVEEQKNLIRTYEVTRKKLESQSKLKQSEIIFLKEKLEEIRRENKIIEKRLNSSGSLSSSSHEKWNFSSLSPTNFLFVLKQTTKSIRSLVKFLISEMESANWDLVSAADSIQPDIVYSDTSHICYAFESFICNQMFDGFNFPEFDIPDSQSKIKPKPREYFFDKFMELKSLKAREYITWKPTLMFAEFCRCKYLKLVHPKLEASLFGNISQRNLVNARKLPETAFFDSFLEVAKWVWLLHCLAFSFGPDEATVFQIAKGSRFSEVFMDSVNDVAFVSPERSPEVAFVVFPGFKVGKTVIQCQVYLV